jgi:hypothetical protein
MSAVVDVKDESIRKRSREDDGSCYDNNDYMRNKKSINDYLKDLSISSNQHHKDSNHDNSASNDDHVLMNDVVDDDNDNKLYNNDDDKDQNDDNDYKSYNKNNIINDTNSIYSEDSEEEKDRSSFDRDSRIAYDISINSNKSSTYDSFIHVIKGGKVKYLRKIDYLVDDLIRKSQRKELNKYYENDSMVMMIPSSIGPNPLNDQRIISNLWPMIIVPQDDEEKEKIRENKIDSTSNSNKNSDSNNSDTCHHKNSSIYNKKLYHKSNCIDNEEKMISDTCSFHHHHHHQDDEDDDDDATVNYDDTMTYENQIYNSNNTLLSTSLINIDQHDINTQSEYDFTSFAGAITHSDWGIEDIVQH